MTLAGDGKIDISLAVSVWYSLEITSNYRHHVAFSQTDFTQGNNIPIEGMMEDIMELQTAAAKPDSFVDDPERLESGHT